MSETETLDPHTFGTDHDCFGCSPRNPIGFRLRFFREGDTVIARLTPGPEYEGPPGIMHGGLQATLADEIAAWTLVGLKGRMGFTASLQVRLLRPVRTGREVIARGRIVRESSRLVTVETKLFQDALEVVRGEAVFAIPDAEGAARILGRALPEQWRRLCRDA